MGDAEPTPPVRVAGGVGASAVTSGGMSPTLPRRLEYVPVDDLPDHPRNPRDHDLDELVDSVRRFGFTSPPMIDGRTGLLAEGHGRKLATIILRDAGETPPEGIVVEDGVWYVPVVHGWASQDDEEAAAYLLAGNQGGGWHTDPLAKLLADLAETDIAATDPDAEWEGMPDYENGDRGSKYRIVVHFATEQHRKDFIEHLGSPKVQQNSMWWPEPDGLLGYDGSRHYVGEVVDEPEPAG